MASVILFGISLTAFCSFIALKGWEGRANRILFPELRAPLDSQVTRYVKAATGRVPALHPDWLKHTLTFIAHEVSLLLLYGLHFLERRLVRLITMIKGTGTAPRGEGVSDFLRTVSEHKKATSGYSIE